MRVPAIALSLCALLLTTARDVRAEGVYRYVEKDGTIVYTNVKPSGSAASTATRLKRLKGSFHRAPEKTSRVTPVKDEVLAEYDALIDAAATRYRIPAALVRAVMHAESAFDPRAVSAKGASGLMQLMPATAQELYVKDIFDARENIEGGTRYLRVLANQFNGDMVKMVAAYNAGPDAVRKYGGAVPPYAETQGYVRKVINLYFQYKAQGQVAQAE
jgi:soluble lytic murein transglycosylase-like protein